MKRKQFYWLFLFLFVISKTQGQDVSLLTIGELHTIQSTLLGEERQYMVSLPKSYEKDEFYLNKWYPVLILLDADTHFQYASSMIHFLSDGAVEQIPEMIVVAVRNTNRTRDMASEPTKFLGFLEKELLPTIEQQYRTLPYQLLVGHSLAGLFALNCFLDQHLFNAYIAIDPTVTWNEGAVLKKAKAVLPTNKSLNARLYLTQSNNPFDPGQHTGNRGQAFDTFRADLASNHSARLFHQYAYYEREDHFSVPFQSLRDGLLFVFENFKFPFSTLLTQGSAAVSNHYKTLFDQLGVNLLPPGKVINQTALFTLYNQKQVDKAIELLLLNETYYPTSYSTYSSLGEAYKVKGDKLLALRNYRKALALKPADEKINKAIEELTNSAMTREH